MSDRKLKPKQVILVRTDAQMDAGKVGSQTAHASMKVFFDRAVVDFPTFMNGDAVLVIPMTPEMLEWKEGEFTKIVLAVHSEEELLALYAAAELEGLPCSLIQDNGHTVFNGVKTYTTAAIGPAKPEQINKLTGHLKLFK